LRTPKLPYSRAMEIDLPLDGGDTFSAKVRNDLEINLANLDEEMVKHPSLRAWYTSMYELYDAKEKRLKAKLKRVAAELGKELRLSPPPGLKRVTDKAVEAETLAHPDYEGLQEKLEWAQQSKAFLSGVVAGFDDRKDMLLELSRRERSRLYSEGSLTDRDSQEERIQRTKDQVRAAKKRAADRSQSDE